MKHAIYPFMFAGLLSCETEQVKHLRENLQVEEGINIGYQQDLEQARDTIKALRIQLKYCKTGTGARLDHE